MKNNYKKTFSFKAFSIIEISIVIVIVGILLAGVSKGLDLYDDFKLTTARNLTLNSPVNRISNLEMWLESTNDKAFSFYNVNKYDLINNINDNKNIAKWNNIRNTFYIPENRDAYNTNSANQPTYIKSGINGVPALYFDGKTDGNGDYLSFNGDFLTLPDATIFIVEKRTGQGQIYNPTYPYPYQYIIAGCCGFSFGYNDYSQLRLTTDNLRYSVSSKLNIARIISLTINSNDGKKIFVNGSLGNSTTSNSALAGYSSKDIARFNPPGGWTLNYYEGYIGEIIIFSKALNDDQRKNIESYLSQKWGIKIS